MPRRRRKKTIKFCFIVLLIFLDQISKFYARSNLGGLTHSSIAVVKNFFYLSLVKNKGTAFGLFKNQSLFFLAISFFAVVFISYLVFKRNSRFAFPLCFILAGASGNLIDRLIFGFVIDFLDFRIWPVFNLADFFICFGAGLLIFKSIRK